MMVEEDEEQEEEEGEEEEDHDYDYCYWYFYCYCCYISNTAHASLSIIKTRSPGAVGHRASTGLNSARSQSHPGSLTPTPSLPQARQAPKHR